MDDYKKILVIKLGALGDFIHMMGICASVRHHWPSAQITLMTGRSFFKLAKQSGYFDNYIEDNRTWNPLDYIRIIHHLVHAKFDLIIDLQMQKRTKERYYTFARLLSKNPFRWAFIRHGHLLIKQTNKRHRFLWGKTEKKDVVFKTEQPSLTFCHADPKVLAQLPKRYVLMIPGCSLAHPYKRWPAEHYRALALRLAEQDMYSVVLGTNAEKNEIDLICRNNPYAVNFCNKSSLLDIPEIASQALAVVGNDTGPQHMAEFSDAPSVTLFSEITQKSAIHRANVINLIEQNIADISVDKVVEALQSLWHKA